MASDTYKRLKHLTSYEQSRADDSDWNEMQVEHGAQESTQQLIERSQKNTNWDPQPGFSLIRKKKKILHTSKYSIWD